MKKAIFTLFISVLCIHSFAQSNKLLDGFTPIDNGVYKYYAAFTDGAGNVNLSLNSSQYSEGTSSLQVDYTFSNTSNASCFASMRSTKQDFSFKPLRFSLDLKGGQANDLLTVRLWEDIDMNGAFDNNDEVWMCSVKKTISGSNNWETATFTITDFVRLVGSGNNKLDLNRIRAWDVAVYNGSASQHTSTLYIDNFRFNSTYAPPAANGAKITCAFVQVWGSGGCNCGMWSQVEWDTELQKMKDVDINKLIVQFGVYDNFAWYSPSSLSFIVYREGAINKIMAAAEKLNMKVILGLYFDLGWNTSDKSIASSYSPLLIKHKGVIDELYSLFGSSVAFEGWYIPQEINDLEWQATANKALLFQYIQDIAAYAHAKDASKKVMISPYFNLWQQADLVGSWYNDFFKVAKDLDLVYPQDGVGMTLKDIDIDIPNFFTQIKAACDSNGVGFGCNMENYHQTSGWPVDNSSTWAATSTPIDVLVSQIQEAKTYNPLDIVTFEWSYMQPSLNTASDKLYTDYSNYVTLITNTNKATNSNQSIEFYPNPSSDILQLKGATSYNSVKIYNLIGEEVYSNINANTIDISGLEVGMYILHAVVGTDEVNEKLIKK